LGGEAPAGIGQRNGTRLTGSARASLWHAFGDGTEVTFVDLSGNNAAFFDSGLGGT